MASHDVLQLAQFAASRLGLTRLEVAFERAGMASVALKMNQTVTARVVEKGLTGQTLTPVGPFTWSAGDPTVATIEVAADTFSAVVRPLKTGAVSVLVSGDGMDASGVVTVLDVIVSMDLEFDLPADLPVGVPSQG